jgi:transposase
MSSTQSSSTTTEVSSKLEIKNLWGVYWLNKEKYSMSRIAKVINISKATVQVVIERIRKTGTPVPKPRPGRSKKLDERDLRSLKTIMRSNPFASYNHVNSLLKDHQINICRDTLIHYVKDLGFGSYFAAHKPRLSEENKKRRLRWAKERVNWSLDDWRRVVWSDESRFTVEGYYGGARVLRMVGERYEERHITPTTKWGKGSVMVWSCFWAGGFGPFVFVDGSVDQYAYVNVLSEKFLPWFQKLSEDEDTDFIFQEDGATCHTSSYTTRWKDTNEIRRFDYWPAQSPDLNPIEHLWSCLEHRIREKRPSLTNVDELKVALKEAWGEIHVDLAARLVGSMNGRCQAVIDAKGGPTKY